MSNYELDDETGMLVILRKDGTVSVRRDDEWISREDAGRALIGMGRTLAEGHAMGVVDTDNIEP